MSDDNPKSRLPDPPTPGALVVVHLYRACCYLTDAMQEDGLIDCFEYDELRGALFAVRMIAVSIESCIHGHPAVRKAEERFMKKLIALDRMQHDVGFIPYENLQTITPSAN